MKYTAEMTAQLMGCTVAQLYSPQAQEVRRLALMLHRAIMTRQPVEGFTAAQLCKMHLEAQRKAYL